MSVYVGLDIGGTKIMAASAGSDGEIIERLREDTPVDLNEGLDLVKRLVRRLSSDEEIMALGAAIGGPLDWQEGIVSPLHQPQWRNVPLKTIMEDEFKCPFYVDVDTNVGALGEYQFTDVSARRLMYLTISTGMGGGFIIDGQIYRGEDGAHPEVAHQAVNYRCRYPQLVNCECGASDCLEALVSGNGIRRIYQKPAEQLTDDEWEEVGYNLGQGLRNLATILVPELFVLGGGIATGAKEKLLQPARKVMVDKVKIVPIPEICLSKLGYESALRGAIALAMQAA